MCGIAGFFGKFDIGLLEAMNGAITHRGPDDAGTLVIKRNGNGMIGMTHRRLSIIDLSADGHQPMTVICERCGTDVCTPEQDRPWLVYNGELYNFRELKEELKSKGHSFRSETDSEVLLHMYAEQGPDMLKRLNGIFAFALFDEGATGQLLLARDSMGVKPLYYSLHEKGFLFASELKAILTSRDISRELDIVALQQYLAFLWSPAPRTPLKAVKKFKPGEAMIVKNGRIVKQWSFYDPAGTGDVLQGSEEQIAVQLHDELRKAVGRQLVADVPVGAFLSGGLDSSAIVAFMRQLQPSSRIQCYSIGFDAEDQEEGNANDLPFAAIVAKHLKVDLHQIVVRPDIIRHLNRMLYHLDEPQADPAPINSLLIAEHARRDGVKVLMSGAGGDDIFAGYRRHRSVQWDRTLAYLPYSFRACLASCARMIANGHGPAGLMANTLGRRTVKALAFSSLPEARRMASLFCWSTDELRWPLYSQDSAAALKHSDTLEPLINTLNGVAPGCGDLDRLLLLEQRHFLADHNLNYTDKTGMAAGIEIRVPFLDLEFMSFAARIPVRMKLKDGIGKAILKTAMRPDLPHDVVYRPKSGFGAPLRHWLRNELRPLVDEVLSTDSLNRRGLFDANGVHRLIMLDRQGRVDGGYTIFSLLCIELWCRMFIDQPVPCVV